MLLHKEAIAEFRVASLIDQNAVSPLLDLFYYYKKINNKKTKNIAKKLLGSSILREQLKISELQELQQFAK